jgi:lysine 2,3-aminomutase
MTTDDRDAIRQVCRLYPVLTRPEYLRAAHVQSPSDPVFRQVAPSPDELLDGGAADPIGEEDYETVPGLLHRFPDRALLLVTSACFVHCRHCMRKRRWSLPEKYPLEERLRWWHGYLAARPEIGEVILSGGDPLTLDDRSLDLLLKTLLALRPRRVIRLHSRAPVVAPSRINATLMQLLRSGGVTRVVTQFNHPAEMTAEARRAAALFEGAGIPLENQAVLLRGVNDDAATLAALFESLAAVGVRPYYLHHPDSVNGAMHFRLTLDEGLAIWRRLQAIYRGPLPEYVVDLPGREGKRRVETVMQRKD